MTDFWTLPGPRRFVEGVRASLATGNNIVLRMPDPPPPDVELALRSALLESDWRAVDAAAPAPPLEVLMENFPCALPPDGGRTVRALCASGDFDGYLVWLGGLNRASWKHWKPWLTEYGHLCRSIEPYRRTLFIIPLQGELAGDAPAMDVCMEHHAFSGVVGELDMLLYAHSLLEQRPEQPQRLRNVLALTLAKVALWDPYTAIDLAERPPIEILRPHGALRALAKDRGWVAGSERCWERGTQDVVDGRTLVHSALLAVAEPEAIDQRLWSAQAGVLLPMIEEQRRDLLPRLHGLVKLPVDIGSGVVADLRELEIGQLAYLLERVRATGPLRQRVEHLRRVRNALAHFRPLEAEQVLAADL